MSTSLMTSEAGSLMSHHGATGRTFQRGQPTRRRRAYGFADTDNSIKNDAAQGCPVYYYTSVATGQTFKLSNLRPDIASRLEDAATAQLQSIHAENLTLLQECDHTHLAEDDRPSTARQPAIAARVRDLPAVYRPVDSAPTLLPSPAPFTPTLEDAAPPPGGTPGAAKGKKESLTGAGREYLVEFNSHSRLLHIRYGPNFSV